MSLVVNVEYPPIVEMARCPFVLEWFSNVTDESLDSRHSVYRDTCCERSRNVPSDPCFATVPNAIAFRHDEVRFLLGRAGISPAVFDLPYDCLP